MIVERLHEQNDLSPVERTIAQYFLKAGESLREQSARSFEVYRDSDNPILHDRRS